MTFAVQRAQLGLLPFQLGRLLAQPQDHRRVGDIAHRFERDFRAAQVAHQTQLGLDRRARSRADQLAIEITASSWSLSVPARLDDVVVDLVARDRLVGLLHLDLELGQPLLEPAGGLVGGGQLALSWSSTKRSAILLAITAALSGSGEVNWTWMR